MMENYIGLGMGRHRIMSLPRITYAVYLSTTDAVLYEADKLHMKLKPEDTNAIDQALNVNFYSIRSRMGAPLVMMKVVDNAVQWCRGYNAERPAEFTRQIVSFIVTKRFGVDADMACTGVIEQNGKYYNIYDLPKGFVYHGNMDLSYAGLTKLPDMRTVTIKGDYNISGNNLRHITGAPLVVEGDFIILDNFIPYLFKDRPNPQLTKIGGKFYNHYYPNGR